MIGSDSIHDAKQKYTIWYPRTLVKGAAVRSAQNLKFVRIHVHLFNAQAGVAVESMQK